MNKITAWGAAVRPKTLSLSIAPVLLGTAAAFFTTTQIDWLIFWAVLLTALLIQIGTNLHNDVVDFEKGADTAARIGPPRAVAEGWLTASIVRKAAFVCYILAFILGIYLVLIGGWLILLIGLASLLAGAAYSGGPWPISHLPLGELFVYVFFGLAAVMGTYYLQTGQLDIFSYLLASMSGLQAAAVLVVNNYRDRDQDTLAGRKTLAVINSPVVSKAEYALLLLIPYFLLLATYWHVVENLNRSGASFLLLSLLTLPWALYLIMSLWNKKNKIELNQVLAQTAQLQLFFVILLVVGIYYAVYMG